MKTTSLRSIAVLATIVMVATGCSLTGGRIRLADDRTISGRVRDRLAEASPALATVEVDTYERTVYLNGPIPSEKAKREAEALARDVDDVKLVVNNLHVPAPPSGSTSSSSATGD